METLERFRSEGDARRNWRRMPVELTLRCKRLGRAELEMDVTTVDTSPGGVRLRAPDRLITGDIVLCWMDGGGGGATARLKGLVVQASTQHKRTCEAHVAWTSLTPESGAELDRLLSRHDPEHETAGRDPV